MTEFIDERQSNWDSISRDYIFIMPLNMKGSIIKLPRLQKKDLVKMVQLKLIYLMRLSYMNEQE